MNKNQQAGIDSGPSILLNGYGTNVSNDYRWIFYNSPHDSQNLKWFTDAYGRFIMTNVVKVESTEMLGNKVIAQYLIPDTSRLYGNFRMSNWASNLRFSKMTNDDEFIFDKDCSWGVPFSLYIHIDGNFEMFASKFERGNAEISGNYIFFEDVNLYNCGFKINSNQTEFNACVFSKSQFKIYGSYTFTNCVLENNQFDLSDKGCDSIVWVDNKSNRDIYLISSKYIFISDKADSYKIHLKNPTENIVSVEISDLQLNRVIFDSSEESFDFIVSKNLPISSAIRTHKQLVSYFSDVEDLKKRYDVRLQKLENSIGNHYIKDWIEEHWNFYGYDKNLIFRNAIILMAFFFLGNMLFYNTLLRNVYEVEKLELVIDKWANERNPIKAAWFYVMHSFVFTCYIFWGLKLDLQHLKLEKLTGSLWVILQYLVGIVCLAYIANIIITK